MPQLLAPRSKSESCSNQIIIAQATHGLASLDTNLLTHQHQEVRQPDHLGRSLLSTEPKYRCLAGRRGRKLALAANRPANSAPSSRENYFTSTVAPASVNFFLMVSASSLL